MNNQWKPFAREIEKLKAERSPKRAAKIPRKPRAYPERDLVHLPLVRWFKSTYPEWRKCIFHFAGERKCSPQQGAMLKAMGCQPGVSDIFICIPNGTYSGFWLELKAAGGKLSESQKEFQELMKRMGFEVGVADTFYDAQSLMKIYLLPCLEWTGTKWKPKR